MEEVTQLKLRSESAKVDTEKGRGKKKKEEKQRTWEFPKDERGRRRG